MTTSAIIYGPPGCGKTRNSAIFCANLGMVACQDPWRPGMTIRPGLLHLTSATLDEIERTELPGGVLVLSYEYACRRVREALQ